MTMKQFNKEVKVVRSDNGTEFTCLSRYFREKALSIKLLVLQPLNKTLVWKENTGTTFSSKPSVSSTDQPILQDIVDEDWEIMQVTPPLIDKGSTVPSVTQQTSISPQEQSEPTQPVTSVSPLVEQTTVQDVIEPVPVAPISSPPENIVSSETLGHGQRSRIPSVKLKDYVTYNVVRLEEPNLSLTGSSSTSSTNVPGMTSYPLNAYVSDLNFSVPHQAFLAAMTAGVEPKSYSEAIKDKVWRDAMKREVVAHEELGTWDLATLPPGKTAIASKWVHRTKYNSDGTIERHKSRLVGCGNRQVGGEDYDETFASVVKMTTVRSLLSLFAAKGWEVHQMDVHNAFFHGDLEEEVYMRLPQGFTHSDPRKVCRL